MPGRSPFMVEQVAVVQRLYVNKPSTIPEDAVSILAPVLDSCNVCTREDWRVVVFGVFKTGKSTLLNALIRRDLLPTDLIHSTGVITELRYGEPKAFVTKLTSRGDETIPILVDDTAKYIRLTSSTSKGVKLVTIHLPIPFLQHGVVLIDSPGLEDDDQLTEMARHALETADLALMVISARHGLGNKERRIISEINALLHGNIVFVGNRINELQPSELPRRQKNIEGILATRGNEVVGKPRIFYVNAQQLLTEALVASKNGAHIDFPLESWLCDLLSSADGERVVLASRLSIIVDRARQAGDELARVRDKYRATAARIESQETTVAITKKKALANSVQKIRDRLAAHRANFSTNYRALVNDAIERVQQRMSKDNNWASRTELDPLITGAFMKLWEQIDKNVEVAVEDLQGFKPPAYKGVKDTKVEYSIAQDSSANTGLIIGGMLGFPFGGLGSIIGAGAGALIAEIFFGKDEKQETLTAIRAALEKSERDCQVMADRRYDQVEAAIEEYEVLYARERSASPESGMFREKADQCDVWLQWLEHLQETVENLYAIIRM